MANEVTIHVKAKDDASKTMKNVEASSKKMGVGVGVAAAAAGAAIVKFGADAIKKASDLNETMNKTRVVFGKNSQEIVKWSTTSAQKLGLSQEAALSAASSFGLMFKQLGSSGKESTNLSMKVVKLAADLGSFHNLDTADVMERISAAFRGEYDSLQQLVPTINAARVQKEALAMTGKKNAKNLTDEEKAMAALNIITKESKSATNDFAETQNGLANKSKILAAKLDNIEAKIGGALLPALSELGGAASDAFDEFERSGELDDMTHSLGRFSKQLVSVGKAFGKFNTKLTKGQGGGLDEFGDEIVLWKQKILHSLADVAEGWAKINPLMRRPAKALREMANKADEELSRVSAKWQETQNQIHRRPLIAKLKADKKDLDSKIAKAKHQLNDKDLTRERKAKLKAEIAQLLAAKARAQAAINSLHGKTVTININRKNQGAPFHASGGNIGGLGAGQAATGGNRGSQTWVGEQGPELVDLPFGSHVNSNADSMRKAGQGGGGGSVHITINAPNVTDRDGLRRMLVDMQRRGQLDVIRR